MNFFFFPILKKVARSFYLTIRLLPPILQEPVALAYLLARASDTIADEDVSSLRKAEHDLIQLLPSLLEQLNDPQRNPFDVHAIKTLWQHILEGQRWDMEKFSSQEESVILTAQELDRYLYLVAGCVGEFWTILAAHHLPDFSKKSLLTMTAWGIDYGKGLQLTNILRDRYEDAQRGRCYCAKDQIPQLHVQALAYLEQGRRYVQALRPGRFKLASSLPLFLAEKTLALVAKNRGATKVKVSRCMVYATLLRALPLLFF